MAITTVINYGMDWVYLNARNEQVPFDESQGQYLVSTRVIKPDTLLWSKSLGNWTAASVARPDLFNITSPAHAATMAVSTPTAQRAMQPDFSAVRHVEGYNEKSVVAELARPLAKAAGWMQFLGVVYCLNFIAIIPIFMAIKCFTAASNAKAAAVSGDFNNLRQAQKEVAEVFMLQGYAIIVGVSLYIIIWIVTLASL